MPFQSKSTNIIPTWIQIIERPVRTILTLFANVEKHCWLPWCQRDIERIQLQRQAHSSCLDISLLACPTIEKGDMPYIQGNGLQHANLVRRKEALGYRFPFHLSLDVFHINSD